ncbi:MAG: shikimate dehydrogenase [Pelagibacterales bacterium]|nr:shikimate dehydrogenase [Pelagibacterales bacterium]|tara:strand:+ start:2162 stop:2992 length:831 start_codon:yes stop_codon:yes gene_type:complete
MIEKKFGIIGKPLSHSLSPELHNFWFKKHKISASYSLIEIELNEIESIIKQIRNNELQGINVTVPYKQAVIPFLDSIVDDAKETLSVNTISLNVEGKIIGSNTDVFGLEQGFINKLDQQNIGQNKILIIGAGGVTPSVIYALSKKGIKKIFLSNRTIEKAEDIKKRFPFIEIVEWESIETIAEEVDIIINATSLGLINGSDFKQEFNTIKPSLIYYDVIYNPKETKMIKNFKKKNIKTYNGLEMFIYQGQKSFYLWNKTKPELDQELKKNLVSKLK